MSASQMLNMCVRYIARRHHMLTDEHVAILDDIWDLYEPLDTSSAQEIPLPPSPPPECEHIYVEQQQEWSKQEQEWQQQQQQQQEESQQRQKEYEQQQEREWREWQEQEHEQLQEQEQRAAEHELWRQTYQAKPVSASIWPPPTEQQWCDGCTCDTCMRMQGMNTHGFTNPQEYQCSPDGCTYECGTGCGAAQPFELPPVVSSVVQTAIESDDDMPALMSIGDYARPKGWYNPEETEIVEPPQPAAPQPKPPKAKPLFPYNHHLWPSPRAKVMVRFILGSRAKDVLGVDTLTHDACMSYLAKHYGLSHEQLLKTSIFELHNPERVAWTMGGPTRYMDLPPICSCCYCKGYRYRY